MLDKFNPKGVRFSLFKIEEHPDICAGATTHADGGVKFIVWRSWNTAADVGERHIVRFCQCSMLSKD